MFVRQVTAGRRKMLGPVRWVRWALGTAASTGCGSSRRGAPGSRREPFVVAGPVVADEHAGEAGQDAKAVGGGVAAVLVRPVPDQAVGAGGVDVAGPAVDRHRRLVVVEPVGAGQRVLQV